MYLDKVFLTIMFLVIGVSVYWAIKIMCDKRTGDYFNANIKDKLTSMFDGQKKELLEHLEDIKGIKEFKESKILICSDEKKIINNMAVLSKFTNIKNIDDTSEKVKIDKYSIIVLFAEDDESLLNWYKFIEKSKEDIPIIIYTTQRLNTSIFNNKIASPVNNQFTLIERLHSAYLIKKVLNN